MIRIIALGVLLGVIALHQMPKLPAVWWLLLFLPCGVLLYLRCNRLILFVNALALGFTWAYTHAAWQF